MKVDKRTRDRFATAIHESAHAVVATLLGGEITHARLTPRDPASLGHCEYATLPDEHRDAVTYAGAYAEARWRYGPRLDLRHIRAVLRTHASDAAVLTASVDGLPRHVEPLIERSWASTLSLAHVMFLTLEIDAARVDAALCLPTDPELRAAHLASIRMGSTPGAFTITPRLSG
ncbi:hypothetical protein [Gordonia sp. NPDC003422]